MKAHWQILVVDDEEVMSESLAAWLREDGYTVEAAASGREGLEKTASKEFAIYFVDLKMPKGMDGIETMLEIKKRYPNASIVTLEQNYRSTQPILEATNQVIGLARERYTKNLWSQRAEGERASELVVHASPVALPSNRSVRRFPSVTTIRANRKQTMRSGNRQMPAQLLSTQNRTCPLRPWIFSHNPLQRQFPHSAVRAGQ